MATRKKSLNFEASLAELEAIVEQLETGELSLEQSLKAFEQGVRLTRDCQRALADAEQTVSALLQEGDEVTEVPFTAEAEDGP